MDEQEFLHKVSAAANVNIELLKDLIGNEKFLGLVRTGKTVDAIILLRNLAPKLGLAEAKRVVDAFIQEYK